MAYRVLAKKQILIPSAFVVRALTRGGRRYHCTNCGERMFVKYESGLCPLCYNGRRPWAVSDESGRSVPDHMALVGVLDDPTVETPAHRTAEDGETRPARA